MKKLAILLTAIVLAFTAVGCQKKKDPVPSVTPSASASVSTAPSVSVAPSVSTSVAPSVSPSARPTVAPSALPSTEISSEFFAQSGLTFTATVPNNQTSLTLEDKFTFATGVTATLYGNVEGAEPIPSLAVDLAEGENVFYLVVDAGAGIPKTYVIVIVREAAVIPSVSPSVVPSVAPSVSASVIPSVSASVIPSVSASVAPSVLPSVQPSIAPSVTPTVEPTVIPSVSASAIPSVPSSTAPSVPQEPQGPTAEDLLAAVTFSNSSKSYNGQRQKIEVANLPQGATVVYSADEANTGADNVDTYTDAGARKPGVYGVKATVTLNGATRVLTAKLTVRKVRLTIAATNVQKELYAPHPEFTYTVNGLKGDDVFYFGEENPNLGVNGGSERATFTGDLILECAVDRYSEVGGAINVISLPVSDCYNISAQSGFLSMKPVVTNLITGTSGGLKMNGDYQMTYNGKVVTWQGVNYYGLLRRCYNLSTGEITEEGIQNSFKGLEDIAAYNVKAIRFATSFFYKDEFIACLMKQDPGTGEYVIDEEKVTNYIYTLKRLYNKAASLNIGLIPSVYWRQTHYEMFEGETEVDAFTNVNSKSYQFGVWLQDLLSEHFGNHPALFMWEYGNEWNLWVDHGDTPLTSDMLISHRSSWAARIEAQTGSSRLIGGGDGPLRPSQYNLRYAAPEDIWKPDTLQEHVKVLGDLNEGISSVSIHFYPNLPLSQYIRMRQAELSDTTQQEALATQIRKQYYEDPQTVIAQMIQVGLLDANGKYVGKAEAFNSSMPDVDTLEEWFSLVVDNAKNLKKTAYTGEYGINPQESCYLETALQHSKYRNSTLSNGMVINGDDFHEGLSSTLAAEENIFVHGTYEDILQFCQATATAQKNAEMPLLLYWNYEYGANIDRLNEVRIGHSIYGAWGDYATGSPYSMSLKNHAKAHIILGVVKEMNDAWDAANPGAYNS